MRKTATAKATSRKRTSENQRADGTAARGDPPGLQKFKVDPVEGARSLLQIRRRTTIDEVLADAEFMTALRGLALKATESSRAAVVLSRFALRPEFSTEATVAIEAAGSWPEPSNFAAEHRRLAADALERVRPPWALLWLAKALVSALPHADLRRFFASRLILASGGLAGAVDAIAKSLLALEAEGRKVRRDHLTLIRELRNCARPATINRAYRIVCLRGVHSDRHLRSCSD